MEIEELLRTLQEKLLDSWVPDNGVSTIAVAVLVAVVVYFVLWVVRVLLSRRLERLAERTSMPWDDLGSQLVAKTGPVFVVGASLFAGSLVLQLPPLGRIVCNRGFLLILAVQAGIWCTHALGFLANLFLSRGGAKANQSLVQIVEYFAKVVVWSVVLLVALDNLGVDVTALVAGVGIGGLALSLALTSLLKDTFASLAIILDRPFEVDDFIVLGDTKGVVERVGIRTTRLRSLTGEQLIVGNDDLLSSRIQNFQRMDERRATFQLGVEYGTPPEKLEAIPDWVRAVIESDDRTRFARGHFKAFGSSALDFEFVYFVLDPSYDIFMDVQQAVNLGVCRKFAEEGISFAFPSATVYLRSELSASEEAGAGDT